ncbi:MAG: dTDP-4-dehydrorhamnose reductase [Acidobacteria bacterium RIFCSPLOWO2_12_FULL_59_11]|nr:MAG: dTDP-4-dehydrorhamnose reductase [Acidobacteria bacterium RIFCSPLOWO2_12_FULL_59_11]
MRVAITGAGGMLGKDLAPLLAKSHEVLALHHAACDITEEAAVLRVFREWQPNLAVNCAAFTDVDGCEREPERAFAINAHGAGNVARAAAKAGARLFHISTDYVFDGAKRIPYQEADATNAINIYGQSKLEGEREVLNIESEGGKALVIRTSWLYGLQGANFVEKILQAAQTQRELEVVADQVGCPTWTMHLAQKIAKLIETEATGILHAAGSGECTRYEFARAIVEKLPKPVKVTPIDSTKINRPAKRPPYSVLDCRRLEELGLARMPHWRQALEEYFQLRETAAVNAK